MAAGLLAFVAQVEAPSAGASPAAAERVSQAAAAKIVRDRLPAALQGRAQAPAAAADNQGWAQLPAELDGRVRVGTPGSDVVGRAGWRMLEVPALDRVELARGAAYLGSEWDLLQSVDQDRLREYIIVREHQGEKTWRWKLYTSDARLAPRVTRDGRIDLGGRYFLEPPKLLDARLKPLARQVAWKLDGDILSLTFDDAGLALPYVIDPDLTPPVANFTQWTESSPYAYYNSFNDINRLWFNPNQSGSAVATVNATDAESGVDYVTWPSPPAGWSPAGSTDSSASSAPGIVGTYYDDAIRPGAAGCTVSPQYPCINFSGISFTRIDPNINFNWGGGTPYAALGTDTFSIRWEGKIEAPENGTYYFQTLSDDGARLWIDNVEMGSRWDDHGATRYTGCAGGIALVAGTKYDIKMEMYENGGSAVAGLHWRLPSQAGTYDTPTGCLPNVSPPRIHSTGWAGSGSTTYPVVPPSAFSTGGGTYTRTFSWTAGASAGSPNITATNTDGVTTAGFPMELVADGTAPVLSSGTFDIAAPGWANNNATTTLNFPAAANFTDAGVSQAGLGAITREIQRRDGVADGAGGCNTTAGVWTADGAGLVNPAGTSSSNAFMNVTAGTCAEFRYVITDAVGNRLTMYASGFRGNDNTNPNVAVTSIAEGANPQYQHVVGANTVFVNTAQAGNFTVTAVPTDAHAGVSSIRFRTPNPGTNWLPAANVTVPDPGPWEQVFSWTAGASNPGGEIVDVYDYAGRTAAPTVFNINRDVTAPTVPGGTTLTPAAGTTWVNTPSVPTVMTGLMVDGAGSGVASYQLQREEVTWTAGACPAFTGTYTDIGSPVIGNPPATLGAYTDTSVVDGKCYRYRVAATDNVSNVGYLAPASSVRVDDVDPTVTLNALPASGSGNITVGGTSADTMSGVASVVVRIEDQSNLGVFTTIYTDVTASPTWGNYTWNTASPALNGTYKVYIDVTDVAGNTVLGAVQHTILLDNSVPTMTHDGFTEGTNPQYQHIDPVAANHRIWVRTTGVPGGDLTANFTPDDPQSGIDYVTTPAGPAGWTMGTSPIQDPGPYSQLYTWTTGANNFGLRNATARNNGGLTSANVPFTIQSDNTNPGGGAITYPTGWHTSTSVTVNITSQYTDAEAGILEQQLERDEVARPVAGTCGGATWPGTYATVIGTPAATLPATITDNTVVSGFCYRYRLRATDNVSNTTTTTSTPTPVAIDAVAPIATIDVTPASPFMATETITGTSDDGIVGPNSGVASVTLRWENLGDATTGTVNTDVSASPVWAINWNTTLPATPDGNYRMKIDVVDVAGNTVNTIATRDVVIDNSPPTITFDSYAEGSLVDCQHWGGLPSTTFYFSTTGVGCGASDFTASVVADDPPGGIAFVRFPNTTAQNIAPDVVPADDATGPSPYTMHYSYTGGATSSGAVNVVANGGSGATTNLGVQFTRDNTGPTGFTVTGPGGASSPSWWTNQTSRDVSFVIGSDAAAGVRTDGHRIERRSAPAPTCAGWSTYTQVSPVGPGPSSPWSDTTLADGTCYQYRIVGVDNVNNETGVNDTTNTIRVDTTLPTGTLNPLPAYVKGAAVALGGTAADSWSGVGSIVVRLGAGPATACTPAVAAGWSCSWDTTAAPNGPTTLVLVVTDVAGNVLDTVTQSTYVDNEVPTGTVTLTEGANPQYQHVVPGPTPRMWVNTAATFSGDFTATTTPTEAFSGMANVSYPDLLTGWTRAPLSGIVPAPGPFTVTYAWTGSGTTANPGLQSAQLADNAANFGTAPFEVVADLSAPTAVALDYADGPTSTPSITFSEGTDADSGIATWQLQRRSTAVIGPNTCDTGAWTAWGDWGAADPAPSPITDGTVALNTCYQYRIVVTDNVGNVTTLGDATSDTVTIEPAGIIITESGGGPSTDVTEGGATDTYTVKLRTAPSANVVVTLGADAQVSTGAPTLTFTPGNWNVAQTVTVTAVNDAIDEVPDPHTGTITHVAASADTNYDALTGADVVASVTDDDAAGFVVSPAVTTIAVNEAGATTDTYAIRLASEPTADVQVALANGDGQVGMTPATLTFTSGNWNVDQTVTVAAIDDDLDEAATHPGVVTHAVTSADPLYAPLTITDATATVTDDDTAGVTVTPTSGLAIDEATPGADTYTVVLDSEPYSDVTIAVAGDADASVAPSSLVFTSANWDMPQTVTMTAIDDVIVEGPHTATASHLATSLDPAYSGIAVSPVTANVTDDDVPGIEVTPTSGLTATEGGTGSSYQIRLETQPTIDVQVAFATGTQLDAITTLTFTSANWNTFQTVNVVATDDDVDEVPDPHTGTIVHTVTGDPVYAGWAISDQSVAITDDDVTGVTVDDLGGVAVDEANLPATDTFTVRLDSQPLGDVTVTLGPDAQVTTLPATLTFTPADWMNPQVVTVAAVNDPIDEANQHPGAVAFSFASALDPLYAALTTSDLTADVADDDTAGITVSPGTLVLDETGPTSDTYTVVLDSEPASNVTVSLTEDAQLTVGADLVFTPANWNVAQTVTATAVDDPTVEASPHAGQITHSVTSGDAAYAAIVPAAKDADITDNDVPGVTVTPTDTTAGETSGTASYSVALARRPATGETVTVDVAPDAQVTALPMSLVFNDTNWNVAQVVTVAAVDDPVSETSPHPGALTHAVSSTDPLWAGVLTAASVNVDITDNDVAGITLTAASPYALDENSPAPGTTVTYSMVLDTQPTADVTVTLTYPGDLDVSPATLTFTSANWNVSQDVTFGAIDDLVTEAPTHTRTITHAVSSLDTFYAPVTVAPVAADIVDNDIPGITVTESSLTATEGGAGDTFDVVLDTQPTADVTITPTLTQVTSTPAPITFTTGNWNIPQTITVDALDDAIDETPDPHAGLVELAVTSADLVYDAWALADIPVDITDNDVAGVAVTPGATAIAVDESGPTSATYDVVLESEPTSNVTITITPDAQTTVGAPTLTFTPGNWNVVQTVTVTAVDDPIDETATHASTIAHTASSVDPHYAGTLSIDDQLVDVTDNDTAAVTVTPIAGLLLDEANPATTATFDVVLDTQPAGNVTIDLTTPDGQTTVGAPSLTFTSANWNVAQTVTVSVFDDDVVEASPHPGVVVVDATSAADAAYDAFDPSDVTADITDDDVAGVLVTESLGSTDVDEGAVTDTYELVLTSQPTADVTISVTPLGSDAMAAPSSLTFTAANWNLPQIVTVSGVPDWVVEGAHSDTLQHAVTSGDASYTGALPIAPVTVNVTDDDVAGVSITPTVLAAAEGGATATYDVVLTSEPASDVTVSLTPDAQVGVSAPTLLFTAADWNVAQTVTVTANDDVVVEPSPHPGLVSHAATSADPDYNIAASDVDVDITDNDIPGVTINPTSVSVTEGMPGATYDVVLDSQPTADVTVTFASGTQVQAIASVTFTPLDWNVAQTITVNATDDFIAEGAHTDQITHDTISADPYYAPATLTIDPVDVAITDNDTEGILVAPATGLAGSEGGAPVTYDVSLTSEPTADVVLTLTDDADGDAAPTTLTFTSADWATPQTVSVAIVDDAIAEGAHTTTVNTAVASADALYAAIAVAPQVVDITDNDTAAVILTPAAPGPLAAAEGGATATYDIVLDSEPTADVTIDLAPLAGQVTAAPASLVFTAANWNVAQTVTITADDDSIAEASPHTGVMTHTANSADTAYAGIVIGDMNVDITDNDVPGVLIDATLPDTSVTEGGPTDIVRVRLATQPVADVTVDLTGTQVSFSSATLTFTSANWNTPQDVTVTAIDDDVFEGPHAGTIDGLSSSGGDPFYAGVAAIQLPVAISDNDTAGVVITQPAASTLDESSPATGQTYQVRLESEPTSDVTVTIIPDVQLAAAPVTLTFTALDWNVDQDVTITPVDDAVSEASPHVGLVTHDTASADGAYATGTLTIDDVSFDITDNDTPGISVTPTAPHAVAEGGATSSYDIVLESQPTADVTIAPLSTQLEWSVPSITFTALDWNVPQTITLRAIDDAFDEADPHPGVLTHVVSSVDTGYDAFVAADVSADITDNDTSDLVLTPASGLGVDEDGLMPPATYTLTLTSEPTADVTVTFGAGSQLATSVPSVVLNAGNWNSGVTVDVTAVDDSIAEGSPHAGTITHAMASADANFDAETGPDQVLDITDNDVAGVTITPSGASTDASEDGSVTDTYDVVLTSEPTADVTITIAADAQTSTSATTLTFTAANWNVAQTVTVTAVDDSIVEALVHPGVISHVASSADPNYDPTALPIDDVNVNVTDDDVAGINIDPAGGSFDIAEGGTTDDLTVTLDSEPVAPVIIDVTTPDGETTAAPAQVTLDSTNWSTGVVVTVTAVDDGYIEGLHSGDVIFTIAPTSDAAYVALPAQTSTAQITDNDAADVLVDDLGGLDLDEAAVGTTDTFEVRLGASPAVGETVTIDMTELAPGGQITFAPTTLTFDDSNWNTAQVVTVTVVDDQIDELDSHTGTIEFAVTSGDTDFDAFVVADLDATIADDDTSALVIDPAPVTVAEAGTTSQGVDVRLATQPAGDVTVTVTNDAQVNATPATLTFTSANWNTVQSVTITAVDDSIDETDPHPGVVTLDVASVADPLYDALVNETITADVADDDDADVTFTVASGTATDEANAATTVVYDVVLETEPTADVVVDLTADAQIVTTPSTLTFTAANWNVAQQVTVRAVDDNIDESDPHSGAITVAVTGADATYAGLSVAPLAVDVADDDTAGVTVIQLVAPTPIDEDQALPVAQYDVRLLSEPSADVTVTLAPDPQVEIVGGVTTLDFTPLNWNTLQTVEVQAVDDSVTEPSPHPGIVAHTTSSSDPAYDAAASLVIPDATFDIADNDVPGFTLNPAAPALTVDEAGATSQTYELNIDTTPLGDVTVDFASVGGDVTIAPASHTFAGGVAPAPVTVTVTAVDDPLVEGPETVAVTHALAPTSDPTYLSLPAPAVPDVSVDVIDNDVADVVIDDLGGIEVNEAGPATDTFEVRLAAQPNADVTVDFSLSPQLQSFSPASLTFTNADWNTPQVITVTPVDDGVTEPSPHVGTFTVGTTSTDTAFDGLAPTAPDVQILDNDVPDVVFTNPALLTMDESDVVGTERQVSLRLATEPVGTVTISAVSDGQVFVQGFNTVTFDSTNWSVDQTLTYQANDDAVAEATPHDGVISYTVSAPNPADSLYAALALTPTTFQITDNDLASAGVACAPGPDWNINGGGKLDLAEDTTAATHDVACYLQLGTDPSAPVTIDITTTSSQLSVDQPSVTFPAGPVSPVLVTFTAVDDALDEADPHAGSISFDVTSTDVIYDAFTIPTVDADIVDNDAVGVVVAPTTPIALTEGGASGSFTIALASEPSGDVTITTDGGAQAGATPASLTFQPSNWNTPQTVNVSAIDDPIDEPDPHPGQVTFTFASSDAAYAALTATPVDLAITDNDTPGVVVTPSGGSNAVSEAGAGDSISLQLATQPSADVVVTLDPGTQLTATPATVTFTSANWNVPQDVQVGAVQDQIVEGEHIGNLGFTLASSDVSYAPASAATPGAQAFTITDDDLAGIAIVETDGKTVVTEAGATDTYTVALKAQPTADVTLAINGGTQVTTAPASLTFTAANWSTPQTVTVTAVQDSIDETDPHPGEIKHEVTTTAAGWTGVNMDAVNASITDDDTAEIIVTQSDDSTKVTEGAKAGDIVYFRLSSQPSKDVSIVPTGDVQVAVPNAPILLTPTSWKDPVQLEVTAVDDQEVEGDHEGAVTFAVSSEDPSYAKAAVSTITVAVTDNDVDKEITDDEGEDETGDRKPRLNVPPTTARPSSTTDKPKTSTSRTDDGEARTDEGKTRLPAGIEGAGSGSADEVSTGRTLGGEVAASTEEEAEPKKKSPIDKLLKWLKEHWSLWAPLLAIALVAGAGLMYVTRGDPVKAAQRNAATKLASSSASSKVANGKKMRVRGRRRKRKDDEEDEQGPRRR